MHIIVMVRTSTTRATPDQICREPRDEVQWDEVQGEGDTKISVQLAWMSEALTTRQLTFKISWVNLHITLLTPTITHPQFHS